MSDAVRFQIQFLFQEVKGQGSNMIHACHVVKIKATHFCSGNIYFFSFRQCSVPAAKKLVSFPLFDCQNLYTANKLIRLQRTRPGDRRINDAAKSTCSETTRHPEKTVICEENIYRLNLVRRFKKTV